MDPKDPSLTHSQSDGHPHLGLEAFGPEDGLRHIVRLCSSFCDAPVLLLVWNEGGIWFREGKGLSQDQWAFLDSFLGQNGNAYVLESPLRSNGEQILKSIPLHGSRDQIIGSLNVLTRLSDPLTPTQSRALLLAASQIQALVDFRQQTIERRALSRGLSAGSFVPGLVHELRNFIFGISASLDAFKANAASQHDPSKYADPISKGLARLNAFVEELRLFGNPILSSKEECGIEPILREAIEHHRLRSVQNKVDIQLLVEAQPLSLCVDKASLALAFIHLIDLALEQESGGKIFVQVGSRRVDDVEMIFGNLDSASLSLKGLDPARLFEPFYFRTSGLGRLALPNARRIIEYHGGSLTALARPEGGTRISFMLPSLTRYPKPSTEQS